METNNFADFLNKTFLYAVVGATVDQTKYGYIVLKDFFNSGYKIVGVNPHYQKIDDIICYTTLKDLPQKPDVVIFVVPPKVGLGILDQVAELGITKVWFQPGAESGQIRQRIKELGLSGVADGSCIMVARRSI